MEILKNVLTLLGSLGVFLYGMKIMSEALQKVAGDRLKNLLSTVTSPFPETDNLGLKLVNRISGVTTGFVTTCIVQSSSATTVMAVSFVNARLLTLLQAIAVVMGANIGTTITAWIVALFGFKVKLTALALPAIGIGIGMTYIRGAKPKQWGEVILGFGLLFLGLSLLKQSVPGISEGELDWVTSLNQYGFLSTLIFVGLGTILTVVLQSSSATMTLTLTLTAMGMIPYDASIAMVLGENIGTTATANIAAIGASAAARRTARAHFLFNIFGVIWALLLLRLVLMPLVDFMVAGDPELALRAGGDANQAIVASHVAAFHSAFNIANTLMLVFFIPQLAAIVTRWIPDPDDDRSARHITRYISTGIVDTPELFVAQVGKEMQYMASVAREMFMDAMRILSEPDADLGSLVADTLRREQLTDDLEREISGILAMTARAATSAEAARHLSEMALNTHRIERIGDHCEKLVRIAIRNHESQDERLDSRAIADIQELGHLVEQALEQMGDYLAGESDIAKSLAIEEQIDITRDRLRESHVQRIQQKDEGLIQGLWLLDALHHLEEIGDRSYGIVKRAEETKRL